MALAYFRLAPLAADRFQVVRRRPSPIPDLRLIDAFRMGIVDALDDLSLEAFLEVGAGFLQTWNAVNDVDCQVETIDLILDREFERSIDIALLLVPTHVNIDVVRPAIRELVNQPRIAVEVEDHRLVFGE